MLSYSTHSPVPVLEATADDIPTQTWAQTRKGKVLHILKLASSKRN